MTSCPSLICTSIASNTLPSQCRTLTLIILVMKKKVIMIAYFLTDYKIVARKGKAEIFSYANPEGLKPEAQTAPLEVASLERK
jgi:hypothetical protein